MYVEGKNMKGKINFESFNLSGNGITEPQKNNGVSLHFKQFLKFPFSGLFLSFPLEKNTRMLRFIHL